MRYLLLAATLICGYFYFNNELKKDLIVYYRYDGFRPEVVENGLRQWKEIKNIRFQKTNSRGVSVLKIYDSPQSELMIPERNGEFTPLKNTIRLSTEKILDDKQWEAVMAHEVGHFLCLDHSSNPSSIMNASIRVSPEDVKNAQRLKVLFYAKQLFYGLIDKITFRGLDWATT